MSTYTFEAEPRVVRAKSKFRSGERETQSRQTPLEMAEESVKAKMEDRRSELRKEQLLLFKKNRQRQNLYELKAAPEPKVEVDLSFFLIEQSLQTASNDCRCTQTDEWDEEVEKEAEEVRVPQKKGVDAETQIWDDDLFDYDSEVEPIINVLVFKTLEQARLEVDEAAEIQSIKQFKDECRRKREAEKEDWKSQVREEQERLAHKNEVLAHARGLCIQQETAVRKLQCVHVAKKYLTRVLHSSISSVIESNYWQSEKLNSAHSQLLPQLVRGIQSNMRKKEQLKDAVHELLFTALRKPMEMLGPIKEQMGERARRKEQLKQIQDARYRRVCVLFQNLARPKSSRLGLYVKKALEGKLEEWESEVRESYGKYKERYMLQEESIDDIISQYNEQLFPLYTDLMLEIDNFPAISFAVASDPYDYLAENYRRYWPEIHLYSEDGSYMGKSSTTVDGKFDSFMRGDMPKREKALRENDDAKITVMLPSVPEEVASLVLTVRESPIAKSARDNWYSNARYRLLDESTSQNVEYEKLVPVLEKVAGNAEEMEVKTVVCGRMYRNVSNMKWIYESYKGVVVGKAEEVEKKIAGFGSLLNREPLPTIEISQWEDEYIQRKIQASKGRKGRKEDKGSKSQSKTEDKKKGKGKKESEVVKVPEEEPEETLDRKLAGYLDFPIGPVQIDCQKDKSIIEAEIVKAFKDANPVLFEKCENGVEIFVKDRLLANSKQILRHGHMLKQFVIRPKIVQIVPEAELGENPEAEE